MRKSPHYSRPRLIERLRHRLDRDSYPRLQMLLIVMLTAGAGFLASSLMLRLGVHSMGLRYFFACLCAYGVFLLLLWLWLRTRAEDYIDLPDPGWLPSRGSPRDEFIARGGQSAGGGSSASYEVDDGVAESSGVFGDALDAAGSADEFAIPLFVVLAVAAMLLSSLFVVWSAPVLFAELLVDGVLAASLYRRLRGLDARHWLESAVRRTFWPFLATALIAAGTGWGLQHFSPRALTVGDIVGSHTAGCASKDKSGPSIATACAIPLLAA